MHSHEGFKRLKTIHKAILKDTSRIYEFVFVRILFTNLSHAIYYIGTTFMFSIITRITFLDLKVILKIDGYPFALTQIVRVFKVRLGLLPYVYIYRSIHKLKLFSRTYHLGIFCTRYIGNNFTYRNMC